MALTASGFSPGRSLLHRLDPRTKQILLILAGAFCLNGNPLFLGMLTLSVAGLGRNARISFCKLIYEVRYFFVFLVMVFAVRVITISDTGIPVADPAAVRESALICWGLVLVVAMGVLLVTTTRSSHIRAALVWFLEPVPFINARSAATLMGLMVRFLPLILFQAAEMADAQRARGIERRKNPLYRLSRFSIPLLRRVFLQTDILAAAMEARCYTDDRTLPDLSFSRTDALFLWALWLMTAGALAGSFFLASP